MHLINSNHFRNMSAFSKRTSQNNNKKTDIYRFGMKNSNSKTTLQICQTDRSQSQANQTINNLGLSQQMESPRLSEFHIKTFIRFRPEKNSQNTLNQQGNVNKKVAIIDKKKILCQDNFFSYDLVFQPPTKQQEIYNSVCKQMVEHFVRGFNSTVFAYGQTGSGKTYTMFGQLNNEVRQGIIPSAIKDIFSAVKDISNEVHDGFNSQVSVSCSMLEIYKEVMIDLLLLQKSDLKIKQNQFFNVSNLTIKQVGNEQQMYEVLKVGNESKKMRQTCMNQASSRSHVIFTVYLEVRKQHQKRLSKFNLVDLAGSQKVSKSKVQGQGLQEAKKINLSLSCLGNTINALLKRNDHIPYRESKLTRLLYESLGGNSLTRLIVTCSSEDSEIQQTLSSLKFAARAKNLKTNPLINTLRKSEKSVSRVAYENLKTNLNKAQYKISKIKSFLSQLKSEYNFETSQTNYEQSIHDKQNKSILSNKSTDDRNCNQKQFQKIKIELSKLRNFAQRIQNVLMNSNKDLLSQLIQNPLKKQNVFSETMSNPFLLISESQNNQINLKSPSIQPKKDINKTSGKKTKQITLKKQKIEDVNNNYWQIIKIQQKQIDFLKKKLILLQNQKSNSSHSGTYNTEQIQELIHSNEKSQQRRNNHIEIENNKSLQKKFTNLLNANQNENKLRKLNIKISNKVLPVKQIFLTSPNNNSSFTKTLRFQNQKNSSSSKSKKSKRQNIILNSPKQFILTENQQENSNKLIETQLREINKKLQRKNQYERFEKNILLRQLELLFDQKIKCLPQNELKNQFQIKQDQNKKITLSETNQLLISQIRYIQQLQTALNHFINKKLVTPKLGQNVIPKKIKLNSKHLR